MGRFGIAVDFDKEVKKIEGFETRRVDNFLPIT
jgi:hypothetical protein